MLAPVLNVLALVLLFTSPAFVLPIILGPIILRRYREDELSRLAGLFTLKPLLATPLWGLIFSLEDRLSLAPSLKLAVTLVPGIGLTLLILWATRRAFAAERRTGLLFLAADALRWLNTFAWLLFSASLGRSSPDVLYVVGLVLPNAYAVMALLMMRSRRKGRERSAQQALGRLEG